MACKKYQFPKEKPIYQYPINPKNSPTTNNKTYLPTHLPPKSPPSKPPNSLTLGHPSPENLTDNQVFLTSPNFT
jgi:hypothetical protein